MKTTKRAQMRRPKGYTSSPICTMTYQPAKNP
jgi:hypothetical protein